MYTEHFGFREHPFRITSDPRFFYPNPGHQEAYAHLVYGVTQRRGFVVLTGEVGTGKTTLLRRLMREFADSAHFAFVYNTTWAFDEVLDAICQDFGLPLLAGSRQLEKVQALNTFLLEQFAREKTAAVLIDEGQNLSSDALENLRLLSNLEAQTEKLLQIILVGQNELEAKLQQPALRQIKDRVAIWSRLDRLKERDVLPFIEHRLHTVGYEGPDLFTPEAIDRIAVYSYGSPRQINIICDNALLVAYGTYQNQVSVEIIEEVARDLGLIQKKAKTDGTLDSSGKNISTLKTTSLSEVTVAGSLKPTSGVFQQEQSWTGERSGAQQTSQHNMLARSKFTRYAIFLAFFIGVVVFVFQDSGASLIGPNFLASQVVELFQAWRIPAQQVVLTRSMDSSAAPSNAVEVPEQTGKRAQGAAEPKTQNSSLPNQTSSENDTKPTEAAPIIPAFSVPQRRVEQQSSSVANPPLGQEQSEKQTQLPEDYIQSGQFITASRGVTVLALVSRLYGSHSFLALDLLKESNPQINDLDKVFEGDRIWIPPFNRETLLRQQLDGSYRLIFSSFRQRREAERCRQVLLAQGYTAAILPQQISSTLKLYRIEIEGLREVAAIEKAWKFALTQDFASLARSKGKAPEEPVLSD